MGNHKFRLSDMIPNAWFYKLRDIGGGSRGKSPTNPPPHDSKKKHRHPPPPPPSKHTQPPPQPPPPPPSRSRKSYHFTRELEFNDGFYIDSPPPPPPPPRKSFKQQKPRRRQTSSRPSTAAKSASSPSAGCSCRTTTESIWTKSDSPPEFSTSASDTSPEPNQTPSAAAAPFDRDIIIDISTKYPDNAADVGSPPELSLPPIITKQSKTEPQKQRSPTRKLPPSSGGVRLRAHSPRIGHRKIGGRRSVSSRRSLSDSLAVMKSSYDPQRDFRESMVEMIVENNIRGSKELEDLLACYLCLNADEYHDLIIKVFKQIWFDLTQNPL